MTLMNIAVDPALQGRGYGAVLLNDLIGRCADLQGELRARCVLRSFVRATKCACVCITVMVLFGGWPSPLVITRQAKENGSRGDCHCDGALATRGLDFPRVFERHVREALLG